MDLPQQVDTLADAMTSEMANKPSDIHEHIPTLLRYARECDTIVEMGVRWIVSTWPLLAGRPKSLLSIDYIHPSKHGGNIALVEAAAEEIGVDFSFLEADTRKIDIEPCDFLFIDTQHVYEQLKEELRLHADKAKKYIGFHDTTSFEVNGEVKGSRGIWPAIEEFLADHSEWQIKERFTNNNGLTILERV